MRRKASTRDMKVGFATVDITPPLGSERPGGLTKAYNRALHDPLHVKAMVLDDGAKRAAFVSADALSLKKSIVARARRMAQKLCGIPGHHILCAATHTHSGGPLVGLTGDEFEDAADPKLYRYLATECTASPDPDYVRHVTVQIANAVALADKAKTSARLAVGVGKETHVSFNRRFRMRDGRQMTHPGKGNPDIVSPAGPIDPDVGVLSAWAPDGRFLGCAVNFACHCTTMGGAISADWPYFLNKTIRGAMGFESTVVFLNGPCGDVTQVDNMSQREYESGIKWARRVGQSVGAEALKVLSQAEPSELGPVETIRETLRIPVRTISPERAQEALAFVQSDAARDVEWIFARDTVLLSELNKREPDLQAEIQAIQIGPAVFVSNPAEYFAQLGLDIKAASPFPYTFVVELANGCIGYTPTEAAMGESGGGYETRLALGSRLVPEAGRMIADASVNLIRSLTPGRITEPAHVPQGTPWPIGSAGPDAV